MNFTGQHRCKFEGHFTNDDIGKIVVCNGEYYNFDKTTKASINESLPIVKLSNKAKDKAVFGVLSDKEEDNANERLYHQGVFVSQKSAIPYKNHQRIAPQTPTSIKITSTI